MLKTTQLQMSIRFLLIAMAFQWIACNFSNNDPNTFREIPVTYPQTLRDTTIVDTLYGKRVSDPFRWLENGSSPATRDWMIRQQTLTEQYLGQIPDRTKIRERLSELWSYDRYSNPIRKGNFYYVLQNEKLQSQPILYRLRSLEDTTRQTILNLNSPGVSGAQMLEDFSFSRDGSLLAYAVSENGARWNSIFVKDMESNRTLLDTLNWVKFSTIAWYRDGFFYSRYPAETPTSSNALYQFQQVFYHRVGSPQSQDELIFADRSNSLLNVKVQTTSDENYLILYAQKYNRGKTLYIRNLQSETLDFTPIIEDTDHEFKVIDNVGNNLMVYTNYKAPNYRLIRINTQRPEERFWENIVPEAAEVLQSVHLYGGKLVAAYTRPGSNGLKIFDLRGKLQREIPVPADGHITGWSGSTDEVLAFFTFKYFTQAPVVYVLNVNDLSVNNYKENVITSDTATYDIRQIRYKTYDGTEIPMTILSKKGLKLDAARPTLLSCESPAFPIIQLMLENNGVCAIAQVRGSEAWGETWRQAGIKARKQNGFDDFQAAAEYLNANKYTNPAKLAIYGKGDGGLLIGASITQRPDLFRVALLESGTLDMIRYQGFTIGWTWADRYGTVNKPDEFDALLAYSPLHNVVPASYPATLILTSNRNNQVVPGHSYKFAAELQRHQQVNLPVLLRIAQGGSYKLVPEQVGEATDMLTFMFYQLQEQINN